MLISGMLNRRFYRRGQPKNAKQGAEIYKDNHHFDTWLACAEDLRYCAKDLRYKNASSGASKVLVKLVVSE